MKRKYSVFYMNVGSCSDRYCSAYGRDYPFGELLDRVKSIELITGVDLVATPDLIKDKANVANEVSSRGLSVVSVAADTFTQKQFRNGSFSSSDASIRRETIQHAKEVMDFTASLGSSLLTLWPGQDGYDYLFQTDYIRARELFIEAMIELCEYRPEMTIGLEYKQKEPRTHSLVNTVGTTTLMAQATGKANCKVIMDYGHALLAYENPAESIAILKQFGNRLAHIHINDNYRLWDDDMIVGSVRTLEFLEFFYWLKKTDYQGWLTIDQFPYREDGRDAVAESAEWMDYLESIIEQADPAEIERVIQKQDGVESSRLMRNILKQR